MANDLRFPIGVFEAPDAIAPAHRAAWLADLAATPRALRDAVAGLAEDQLDTPYRAGGWTVRQLVHHLPDSHANGYTRFKLALTEPTPTIKPYLEARWAELPDSRGPIGPSLDLVEALHARWVSLLGAIADEAWARTYVHPEHGRALRLDEALGMYAWHGRHHVAHVAQLREREGW